MLYLICCQQEKTLSQNTSEIYRCSYVMNYELEWDLQTQITKYFQFQFCIFPCFYKWENSISNPGYIYNYCLNKTMESYAYLLRSKILVGDVCNWKTRNVWWAVQRGQRVMVATLLIVLTASLKSYIELCIYKHENSFHCKFCDFLIPNFRNPNLGSASEYKGHIRTASLHSLSLLPDHSQSLKKNAKKETIKFLVVLWLDAVKTN